MIKPETNEALKDVSLRITEVCGLGDPSIILRILYETLGGMRLTVPTLKELYREERNKRIRMKFNGANYGELAETFGIKERHVRRIINKQ